jgi:hypothetical protein
VQGEAREARGDEPNDADAGQGPKSHQCGDGEQNYCDDGEHGRTLPPGGRVNQYLKFIVAALSAAGVVLSTAYPASRWSEAVIAGIGAALVYLVPNTPKPPVP